MICVTSITFLTALFKRFYIFLSVSGRFRPQKRKTRRFPGRPLFRQYYMFNGRFLSVLVNKLLAAGLFGDLKRFFHKIS